MKLPWWFCDDSTTMSEGNEVNERGLQAVLNFDAGPVEACPEARIILSQAQPMLRVTTDSVVVVDVKGSGDATETGSRHAAACAVFSAAFKPLQVERLRWMQSMALGLEDLRVPFSRHVVWPLIHHLLERNASISVTRLEDEIVTLLRVSGLTVQGFKRTDCGKHLFGDIGFIRKSVVQIDSSLVWTTSDAAGEEDNGITSRALPSLPSLKGAGTISRAKCDGSGPNPESALIFSGLTVVWPSVIGSIVLQSVRARFLLESLQVRPATLIIAMASEMDEFRRKGWAVTQQRWAASISGTKQERIEMAVLARLRRLSLFFQFLNREYLLETRVDDAEQREEAYTPTASEFVSRMTRSEMMGSALPFVGVMDESASRDRKRPRAVEVEGSSGTKIRLSRKAQQNDEIIPPTCRTCGAPHADGPRWCPFTFSRVALLHELLQREAPVKATRTVRKAGGGRAKKAENETMDEDPSSSTDELEKEAKAFQRIEARSQTRPVRGLAQQPSTDTKQ